MSDIAPRRYWACVGIYVVALLLTQSVMGLGIDKFKELWGTGALEVVAYVIVALGAAGVAWVGRLVWAHSVASERVRIAIALAAYGVGTLTARSPQERLHYLGYGLLALLLYVGLVRERPVLERGATRVPAFGALAIGSLIGFADELLQIIWPRRYFDWADVAMNVVAVGLGLLVAVPAWNAASRRRAEQRAAG